MGTGGAVGDVAEHYDDLDPFYRDVWGEHVHHGLWLNGDKSVEEATESLALKVVGALDLQPGNRVVDIGCGYGATTRMVGNKPGVSAEGWTVSRVQYDVALAAGGAEFRLGDWLENDLDAESFDAAFSIECLSHVGDVEHFFEEVERVLRPGGRFVLCCWLAEDSQGGTLRRWVVDSVCRGGRFAGIETEAGIRKAGFEVIAYEDLGKQVRRTWLAIGLRVFGKLLTVPDYRRRFLWRAGKREWGLALSALMAGIGYYTGILSYGFFVLQKRC